MFGGVGVEKGQHGAALRLNYIEVIYSRRGIHQRNRNCRNPVQVAAPQPNCLGNPGAIRCKTQRDAGLDLSDGIDRRRRSVIR
jgi:hypothetical protein